VDALRCITAASGFRNVYESGRFFVAKVKYGGRLRTLRGSRSLHAHQAAAHVVRWYKDNFGNRWRAALANRKRRYWRVSRSRKYGGWIVTVWGNGKAVTVDGGRLSRPAVFSAKVKAVDFALEVLPTLIGDWAAWRS
jgi:hypothetical protein